MKKIIIVLLFACFVFTGCKNKDFSKYPFTETSWSRNNGHDIETINFKTNGNFSYTCACGNPVNDADLCENYTYNEDTKEIKLKCFETTEDTITTIKVINTTDDTLELDFGGEIRKFEKNK